MNIRKTVTTKELLDKIGIPVGEDGFICCPGHEDSRPSLKVYDNYDGFYCFQCRTGGGPVEFLQMYKPSWDEKKCVKTIIQSFKLEDGEAGMLRRLTEAKDVYDRHGTTRLTSMVFEEWEKEFCKWGVSFIHMQAEELQTPLWNLWDHFLERVDGIQQQNYLTKSLRGLPELYKDMRTTFMDMVAFINEVRLEERKAKDAESNGDEGVLQPESEPASVGVGSTKSEDSGEGVGGQDTTCC